MHPYRTHRCDALRAADVGQNVRLSGWVHRVRDHGQLVFLDLRDHYGITQCVADSSTALFEPLSKLKNESVVTVTGKIVARAAEAVNKNLATGEIEIVVESLHVESAAEPLPLQVNADAEAPEATRLTYRFLDLRREKLHKNIVLRSQVISALRARMTAAGFLEFQTPILTASSPEGARDYLVPSRVHPGKFYALPQAPQMFKQLLMVSGFDRYFQIAPCFRDEDARADRSPGEFYQLDIEMSFVTQDDVFAAIEPVMQGVFEEFSDWKVTPAPFVRIPYDTAMLDYGSDKPDLRNPLLIEDVTEVFRSSEFRTFADLVEQGAVVRAIRVPNIGTKSRSFYDKLNSWAIEEGKPGLAHVYWVPTNLTDGTVGSSAQGPLGKTKNLSPERLEKLTVRLENNMPRQDAIFFVCDKELEAAKFAGLARTKIAEELDLLEKNVFKFCWIVDFPYFEWNEEDSKIDFSHNPFSMPQGGLATLEKAKTKEELLAIKAHQYDIVCNGVELSSGAIRNHRPDIMVKAFEIAGYSREDVENRFGSLFRAFHYGAPPHGGLAPGVDRIVMLLANEPNIREVICFPMNQQAQDLLMNAPNTVGEKQLRELNIQLSPKAKQALEEEKSKSDAA